MNEDTTPVLVGAGQFLQRHAEPAVALSPLAMMAEAARRATDDAGLAKLDNLDLLAVVDIFGWSSTNPPRMLAEALGIHAGSEVATTVGGNSPQALVNELARRIEGGRLRSALIAGGNAVATLRRARRAGVKVEWPGDASGEAERFGSDRSGSTDLENDYSLYLPMYVYPLFENALRAERSLTVAETRDNIGRLLAPFSDVAAKNPYAWFPEARSAEEIATVTAANRQTSSPYTKYMNAVMETDQAAALLLTSAAEARSLGIAEERWVYVTGGGDASEDPWFFTERPSLSESPALARAGRQALAAAGVDISEIDLFDLYSCFPVAVEMACRMLGLAEDDPRPFTVTGGLPYFGGPGNNYSTHAIAEVVARLRANREHTALVTANGWYLTKHAAGVYSGLPVARRASDVRAGAESPPERPSRVELATEAAGSMRLETHTVLYGRDGVPTKGIVVGRLDDGRRALAFLPEDRDVLETMSSTDQVHVVGDVRFVDGRNRFSPN